jgi:replicative DNA helicase
MNRIELSILSNLLHSEKYSRVVIPFLKPALFQERVEGIILEEQVKFFDKHGVPASPEVINLELRSRSDITDAELASAEAVVTEISENEGTNHDWLIEKTEEFCKKRAVYLAILESIQILEKKDKKNLTEDAIPKLLQDALAVSFDSSVGHDYLLDAGERWEEYNREDAKIPFGLQALDEVTDGGMRRKAMYCIGAVSGGGKSILMTHTAASVLKRGMNVLYVTGEMAEERIGERIDANLMNVKVKDLKHLQKDIFMTKIDNISLKTVGRLFIKEYPPTIAHAGHIRGLIEELKIKQNFKPDVICLDYLGLFASARMRMGGSVNTYTFLKAVAEEMRSLAIEYDVAVLTGAQFNRGGYDNSDVDMSDTADSMGIIHTLDGYFGFIATEELEALNQILVKTLKNRYGEKKKFVLGLDKSKMQFYDLEASAQFNINQVPVAVKSAVPKERDIPLFDKTKTGRAIAAETFKF